MYAKKRKTIKTTKKKKEKRKKYDVCLCLCLSICLFVCRITRNASSLDDSLESTLNLHHHHHHHHHQHLHHRIIAWNTRSHLAYDSLQAKRAPHAPAKQAKFKEDSVKTRVERCQKCKGKFKNTSKDDRNALSGQRTKRPSEASPVD